MKKAVILFFILNAFFILYGQSADEYLKKGLDFIKEGKFTEALGELLHAEELDPGSTQIFNNLGICYYNLRLPDKARLYYDKAIELDPKNYEAYFNRANLFFFEKSYYFAAGDCDDALKIKPDYYDARCLRAVSNIYRNLFDEAEADSLNAININAGLSKAYQIRGDINLILKRKNKALLYYSEAISLNTDKNSVLLSLYYRGYIYEQKKDFNKALQDYNYAIYMDKTISEFYVKKGNIYYLLKDYANALAEAGNAIEFNESSPEAYFLKAKILYIQKHYNSAETACVIAKEFDPLNLQICRLLRKLYLLNGKKEAAEKEAKFISILNARNRLNYNILSIMNPWLY